jgi:hypothetical protein
MKIRISQNTLRLRVSEEEMFQLKNGAPLVEELVFPNGKEFLIKLGCKDSMPSEFDIRFEGDEISVDIHDFLLAELQENPKGVKLETATLTCYVEIDLHKRK